MEEEIDQNSHRILKIQEESLRIDRRSFIQARRAVTVAAISAALNALVIAVAILIPARDRAVAEYNERINERYELDSVFIQMNLFYQEIFSIAGGNARGFDRICEGRSKLDLDNFSIRIEYVKNITRKLDDKPLSLTPDFSAFYADTGLLLFVIDSLKHHAQLDPPNSPTNKIARMKSCRRLGAIFIGGTANLRDELNRVARRINMPVPKEIMAFDQPGPKFHVGTTTDPTRYSNGLIAVFEHWQHGTEVVWDF
jgi:hypothetical protein